LELARQAVDKAYSEVDKAENELAGHENDGDIAESSIEKAEEQKIAAKKMILNSIILKKNGKSGTDK
jgi:hypothetical protein